MMVVPRPYGRRSSTMVVRPRRVVHYSNLSPWTSRRRSLPIYGVAEEEVEMRRLHSVGEELGILFISLLCGAWVVRGAELGDIWRLVSELVGVTVARSCSDGG